MLPTKVKVFECFFTDEQSFQGHVPISESSGKGIIVTFNEASSLSGTNIEYTRTTETVNVSNDPEYVYVVLYTFPYAFCTAETIATFERRRNDAVSKGAIPSYFPDEDWKFISVCEWIGGARVRGDGLPTIDTATVIDNGCMGIIRRDQLLDELCYIVGIADKYGA